MIGLALQFLSGRLINGLRWALRAVTAYPWQAALVVSLLAFAWAWNGWGNQVAKYNLLSGKHNALVAKVTAQAKEDAARAKRLTETGRRITSRIITIQQDMDHENETIRGKLDAALVELRKRPVRPANYDPAAPAFESVCTGARLARDDAEFLTRFAADAASTAAALKACSAAYDAARSEIDRFNTGEMK